MSQGLLWLSAFFLTVLIINLSAVWTLMLMDNEKENDDGVHRETDQEVHGSAAGSSSGSQPTGTFIAQSPGHITRSNPGNPGTYTYPSGITQTMTVPGSTPGYAFGHASQQQYQQMLLAQAAQQINANPQYTYQQYGLGYSITGSSATTTFSMAATEPKKKIKDEGIRVGEIIAYRCWPIKNGFLWSTAAGRAWAPGEPMKAGENHLRNGLGVYAFKNMSRCIQDFGRESFYGCGVAYGSVVLWGEIVEHEVGYRAEYAAVRSIEFVRDVDARFWQPDSVENLKKLYKVEGK